MTSLLTEQRKETKVKSLQVAYDTANVFKAALLVALMSLIWIPLGWTTGAYITFASAGVVFLFTLMTLEWGSASEYVYVPKWLQGDGPPYLRIYENVKPAMMAAFEVGSLALVWGLILNEPLLFMPGGLLCIPLLAWRVFFTKKLGPLGRFMGIWTLATLCLILIWGITDSI